MILSPNSISIFSVFIYLIYFDIHVSGFVFSAVLNSRGESICLVADLNENASNISHLTMFAVEFRKSKFPPILSLPEVCTMNSC